MTTRIAILHYTSPPTVGGVESTIAYHARGLADSGYAVRVISGNGATFDDRVETWIDPFFNSTHHDILQLKTDLDNGQVTPAFWTVVDYLRVKLKLALTDCAVCIVHNVCTLHKNLALTTALASAGVRGDTKIISWTHDLAFTNPQYTAELHRGHPWDLLRQPWPGLRYVTVSEARQYELAELFGVAADTISVVTPGIDPARFFNWTPTTADIVRHWSLLDADGLLLLPARLTRRKNIELALRVLAEARRLSGADFRLLVTGPPGPHNPGNLGYLGELLASRGQLGLDNAAHFLYSYGNATAPLILDEQTIANLYQLSDALLFPSTQEGFGIPILEAGLAGLPAFCADIPALHRTGQEDAFYFDPATHSPTDIATCILNVLNNLPTFRLRVRVRQSYRWDRLIRERLIPLLEVT